MSRTPNEPEGETVRMGLLVPRELVDGVDELRKRHGLSRSQVVRAALRVALPQIREDPALLVQPPE